MTEPKGNKKVELNNELTKKRREIEFLRDLKEQGLTKEEIKQVMAKISSP
ncbi:hypothetical protein [Shewanella baltica]|nr:hypothetical protein [Shewanella baltica]AEH16273.1 hypothetical protein Sbal117_4636 [Shewanella baltica OS117]